jgi:hypothetical protein
MADQKISELTALTGANVADDDAIAIVDTSATETKKIVFSELKNALDTATGFVRITGDTMTGDLNVLANVGIGTSSPMVALNVHDSTNARIALTNSSTGQTFPDGFELLATGLDAYVQNRSNGNMIFTTNNSERMRIDSSGNLLVGKTVQGLTNAGFEVAPSGQASATQSGASALRLNRLSSDGEILQFRKDGSTVGSIGSVSGAVSYIVLDPRTNGSGIRGTTNGLLPANQTGAATNDHVDLGSDSNAFRNLYLSNAVKVITATNGTSIIDLGDTADSDIGRIAYDNSVNAMYFKTNNSEAMRIDSSGHVLVGTTDNAVWNDTSGTGGINLRSDGILAAARNGGEPLLLNRLGTDGELIKFNKDGSTVGSIRTSGGTIQIDSGTAYSGLGFDQYVIYPRQAGSNSDGAIDLGYSNYRYKDLYL